MRKEKTLKKEKGRFDLFLLEIVIRIARHWGCDIHLAKSDKKGNCRWIKLVFPRK